MSQSLPPVIRVFISSTFADMKTERQYFNTVVVPQLNRLCSEHGISFFSVDLRWGITQEDQINGNVVQICLREIDNCRPFFIGILGNRYGSVLNDTAAISARENFPWLDEMMGKSVTEIEMYYGVLRNEKEQEIPDCVFLFQSPELAEKTSMDNESEDKKMKLQQLKNTIRNNEKIPSYDYRTMEEFGVKIIDSVRCWIEQKFPNPESIHEARRNWYNSELLRDYIKLENTESFFDRYCGASVHSLMVCGRGRRGKTTALSAWQPKDGEKILINCGADDEYQYWPAVAQEIINRIREIDENVGFPEFEAKASLFFRLKDMILNEKSENNEREHTMYYVTDADRNSFRKGFVSWLKSINPCVPVYIVINDLNYLIDTEAAYLGWLPETTQENVHIICSVNDEIITDNARMLGWNLKEMPLFEQKEAAFFLNQYLGIFGKNMSSSQKENLLHSSLLRYPGNLKFIIQFLNNYGNFENLDEMTEAVSRMSTEKELYRFVLNHILEGLSPNEKQAAQQALFVLAETSLGLSEDFLNALVNELTAIDAIEWSGVRLILEQFQIITANQWKIWDADLREAVRELPIERKKVHRLLGKSFFNQMDREISRISAGIRKNTDLAESAVLHTAEAEAWDDLLGILADKTILYYLSKMEWKAVRSAWMRLIIFSDVDVSEKLMDIFNKCDSEYGRIEGLKRKLIALMGDLELWDIYHSALQKSGISEVSDLRVQDLEDISLEAAAAQSKLSSLKEKRNFLQLLNETEEFLAQNGNKLNDREKCLFYVLKLDAEMQMGNNSAALDTSYQFYTAAIGAMGEYNITRAVLSRASLLYFDGRLSETLKYIRYAESLALNLGSIREYLSAANLNGLCLYRVEKFEDSIDQFEKCMYAWRRLRNDTEMIICWLNKTNAIHLSGDAAGSISELKKIETEIEKLNLQKHIGLLVKAKANMAGIYDELNRSDEAEATFLEALQLSKEASDVTPKLYYGLIDHYKKYAQHAKAIDVYIELCEFLDERRMFGELAASVRDCNELMQRAGYFHESESFKQKWRERFSHIRGGSEYLEQQFQESNDRFAHDQLKEDLVVARNEMDYAKAGRILFNLGIIAEEKKDHEAPSLFIEAMEAFMKAEDSEKAKESACRAADGLIDSGFEDPRFEKVYETFDNIGKQIIDHWLNLHLPSLTDDGFSQNVRWILDHIPEEKLLTGYCLVHEFGQIKKMMPQETIVETVQFLKSSTLMKRFVDMQIKPMLHDANDEITYLLRNYSGMKADSVIDSVEKKIALFETLEHHNAGALAGNLALVYRRRRDKINTIKNHEKAAAIFQKQGMIRDKFIELLNLATAYRDFDDEERAIDLLRDTLKDPDISECRDVQASVAGNLASFLMHSNSQYETSEILRCFEIEEKYFGEAGENRELVVSLLNQIQFHLVNKTADPGLLKEKLLLAEKIVNLHQLREFVQVLRKLRSVIMPDQQAKKKKTGFFERFRKNQDEPDARALLDSIVTEESSYGIGKTDEETETSIHAVLYLKKDVPFVNVNIHLWIDVSDGYMLRYMFIMQPGGLHNRMGILMKQYASWWNEQGDYELEYDENNGEDVILSKDTVMGNDWTEISSVYKRIEKLWMADILNMSLGAVGVLDLEDFQKMKLELMAKMVS